MASLDICYEKVNRAETRLAELNQEIRTVFGGGPYDIPGEYDPKTHRFSFYWRTPRPVPPLLDVIVGEIAQLLRSALNNLVAALGGTSTGTSDFPIFTDETEFRNRGGEKKIKLLQLRHQAAIKCLQPYQRAEPEETPLAILNDLAREDKHRLGDFSIATFVAGDYNFQAISDIAGYGEAELFFGVRKEGEPLAYIEIEPSGPNPELHIDCDFTILVAFRERWTLPHPFPRLIVEVRDILDAFAVPLHAAPPRSTEKG